MAKKKWYVVIKGRYPAPGIFESWIETAPLVFQVSCAVFESFTSEDEARAAFSRAERDGRLECVGGSHGGPPPDLDGPGSTNGRRSRSASTSASTRPLDRSHRTGTRTSALGRTQSEQTVIPRTGTASPVTKPTQNRALPQPDAGGTQTLLSSSRALSRSFPSPPTGITVYVDSNGNENLPMSPRDPSRAQSSAHASEYAGVLERSSRIRTHSQAGSWPSELPPTVGSGDAEDDLSELDEDLRLNLPSSPAQAAFTSSPRHQPAPRLISCSQSRTPRDADTPAPQSHQHHVTQQPLHFSHSRCTCFCHRETFICCCCRLARANPRHFSSITFRQPASAVYSSVADPRSPLGRGAEVPSSPSFGRPSPVYTSLAHEMSSLVIENSRSS